MSKGAAKNIPAEPDRIFLPYQTRWVDDTSRLKLMEKSRQIGLSWSTSYAAVERIAPGNARVDQWVSSRDDIQARLFLEDCKRWAKMFDAAAKDLGEIVLDADKKITAYVLAFANGKRIHSMSSNPDAQAGKVGGRVLDEFALHPDPRKLYSIAYPGITWGGQLEIVSTHRGSANMFNKLVEECRHKGNPKKFSLHRVTLQDALDQGFLYKLQRALSPDDERMAMDEAEYYDFIRNGCADEEQFLQEYMCVPADDAGAFLSYDLITPCEYRPTEKWRIDEINRPCPYLYAGIDVGRKKDLTVLWVVERIGDMLFTRELIELQKMAFSDQEKIIFPFIERPDVARVCIDATGLGMQFAERAAEKFGYKAEAVTFTGPVKEKLAYPVRSYFEDKRIRVPDSDAVRSDLRKIRKTTTAAGNIRFVADSDDDGHADRFWALALAIEAAKNNHAIAYGANDPEFRERAVRGIFDGGTETEKKTDDGTFHRPGKITFARDGRRPVGGIYGVKA